MGEEVDGTNGSTNFNPFLVLEVLLVGKDI